MKCSLFLSLLLLYILMGQKIGRSDSIPLRTSREITPVTLTSITTRTGLGVALEYGPPGMVEAGTRLRKLVHNFGRQGFVLV
jgi:hypothetical protein